MKIGLMELVVVFLVALVVIGPDKLPGYARKLGVALREFRKASADITKEVRENVVEPLEEAQRPLREAVEPLEELDREVRGDLKGLEKDLKEIGKTKAKPAERAPAPEPAQDAPAGEPAEGAAEQEEPEIKMSEDTGGENQ